MLAKKLLAAGPSETPPGAVPLRAVLPFMDPFTAGACLDALKHPLIAANDYGEFDTATLIEVLYAPAQAVPPQFWLQWFPRAINSTTEEIRFDSEDLNEYRLAPFVAPNVQGRVMRAKGYNVKSFRPAYVKPKHVVDPSRAIPRRAGERPLGELTLQQRFDAIVADNLRRERQVIENRWEWMACCAIVDGGVTVSGEDYPTVYVDFGRAAALSIVLAGAAKWDQATAKPMTDIAQARKLAFDLGGAPVNRLVFGLDAWSAFVQDDHPDVQKLLDNLRKGNTADFNAAGLSNGAPYEYQGSIAGIAGSGRLDLWTYNGMFDQLKADGSGDYERVPYLDQGTVVGVGTATDGIRCFGAIMDKRANLQALEMFPKQWDVEDPSASYTMTQSAPLMVPLRPNNSFKLKVV